MARRKSITGWPIHLKQGMIMVPVSYLPLFPSNLTYVEDVDTVVLIGRSLA